VKRLLVMLWVLALTGTVLANIELRADVDRDQIDIQGRITLTITIAGAGEGIGKPDLPPLRDFNAVPTGSRQNLVVTNGVISQSISYTYTLIPRKTGNLTIGRVLLETPDGRLATEPIPIVVTQATYRQPRRNEDAKTSREEAEPFFVEATVDQDTVYLGEQLTYTFSYYRDMGLTESNSFTPPQTTGFISVDLPPQRKRSKLIGSETYSVVSVVKAMFPTRTGALIIGSARLRVVPDMLSNLLGRDPFQVFRGQRNAPLTAGEPRNLATRAFEIRVKPLPPVPAGLAFSGAVGECRLGCQINEDSVSLGDPVTVSWTVTGRGRKDVIDAPRITWPEGLETYPPTTELQTSTRNDVVSETKIFSIAVVPRREGTIEIPSPQLTYFDPDREEYRTARGRKLVLHVGPPRAGMTVAAPTQTISAAASTIRYLKPPPESWDVNEAGGRGWLFTFIQIFPPVLVLGFYAWKRRSEAPEQRARGARQRHIKAARKRIAALDRSASTDRAADELSAAFRQYLVARFSFASGELLDTAWTEQLAQRGCDSGDAEEAGRVLEWADRARFGGGTASDMSPDRVLKLMTRLDRCGA